MSKRKLNVALIGYQFMGKAHSNAYRQVARFFDDLEVEPVLKVICGRNEENVRKAAQKYGWEEYDTSWERVIERKDIDLVDVSVPGNMHAPIAIAAANAGKMVLCEKPLANTLADARQMYEAVQKNKVPNALCHNYRFAPAVQLAKQLIDEGRIGKIYHFRGTYLQDWIVDPSFPLVWRLQKEVAGSGSHGDLNAHLIDMARFLVGEINEVSGMMETFIKQRPKLAASDDRLGGVASSEMGEVTVDDAALFLVRFDNGAIGSIEATRFALGRKNFNRFEINGSKGSLVFNMERMNELEVYFNDDPPHARGFRVLQASDSMHPFMSAWWPVGHIIGYEHTFINLVYTMLKAFDRGEVFKPDFEDGVRNQAVLEAVDISSQQKRWVSISEL